MHLTDFETVLNHVTLKRVNFALQQEFSRPALMGMEVKVWEDMVTSTFIAALRGFLLGEDVREEVITYPATWWDAVKQRWFPRWALKRWPVTLERHIWNTKCVYPEFQPALPKEQHVYRLIVHRDRYEG